MEIKSKFDHYNFNVCDLEKSIKFYEDALGFKEIKRKVAEDDSFILVYLGDKFFSPFSLELTWIRDFKGSYNLGDNEVHLCVKVEGIYDETFKYHKDMGCVCFENKDMGLYFINDPDNHWIEILELN